VRGRAWVANGAAAAVPAGLALASSPLRTSVPNAAVAAVLVGLVASIGPAAHRWAAVAGGLAAAAAYDLLWTRPYGSFQIHSAGDIATSVTLLVVGVVLSERGRRTVAPGRPRRAEPRRRWRRAPAPPDAVAQLLTISRVAGDIAEGDPAGLVLLDVARGMVDLLKLRDCRFELAPLAPSERPTLQRSGMMLKRGTEWSPARIGTSADGFEIPVTAHGEVEGRFVCITRSRQKISDDRIRAALTLADQAALALRLSPENG